MSADGSAEAVPKPRLVPLIARGVLDVAKGIVQRRDGGGLVAGTSRARPIAGDARHPDRAEVVVVGGGYIGCMTALNLAERGVDVILCEKGVVGGESSGRSLGLIEGQFLDPSKVEMIARSKRLWAGMNERVGGDTGYRRTGMAALIGDPSFLAFAESWVAATRGMPGIDARMLSRREVVDFAGGSSATYIGGIHQPSDAVAEPELAAPAMADAVRRRGGKVVQHCAVRGIETTNGTISAVVTEQGRIACNAVILAGGAWSPIFLRNMGLDLPQIMAFSSVTRLRGGPMPETPVLEGNHGLVMRRSRDGGIDIAKARGSAPITPAMIANLRTLGPAMQHLGSQIEPVWNWRTFFSQWRMPKRWALDDISPFERDRILQPETRHRLLDEVERDAGLAFPALAQTGHEERWAGVLTSTPDNMPVLSTVAAIPGLVVGSGFYFGLTMAPAAGEALADLAMGATPSIDLADYRFERFSDGSPLVFRP